MKNSPEFIIKKVQNKPQSRLTQYHQYATIHEQRPNKNTKARQFNKSTKLRKTIYSLALQSKFLIKDIDLGNKPGQSQRYFKDNQPKANSQSICKEEKDQSKAKKQIKLQRFSCEDRLKQKPEAYSKLQEANNKERLCLLRRVMQNYHLKSLQRNQYSNLINNLGIKITNGVQVRNRFANTKPNRNKDPFSIRYDRSALRIKNVSQLDQMEGLVDQFFYQSSLKVEARSIDNFLSLDNQVKQVLEKAKNLNDTTMIGLRQRLNTSKRKSNQQLILYRSKRKQASKSTVVDTSDNAITQKVSKYKQFLFMINFAHKVYRELDIAKYEVTLKVFIGRGNNSNLIRAIMKKRFWFQQVKKIEQANFVWTQLKEENVFKSQNSKEVDLEDEIYSFSKIGSKQYLSKSIASIKDACLPDSQAQQKSLILDSQKNYKQKKDRSLKINYKTIEMFHPQFRIMTQRQMQAYNELIDKFSHKKRANFTQRVKYLRQFSIEDETIISKNILHNHLPLNGLLGNKKAMFYMLREYYNLKKENVFQTVPLTFHIKKGLQDEQFKQFMNYYNQNKNNNKPNYWIIKPGEFSNRGQGISCTTKAEDVRTRISDLRKLGKNKSLIVQQYMTNPLLYNGRKFDIRTYMLVSVNNHTLRAYWYQDGYIRTSSYLWKLNSFADSFIHLTNDAIQKYSDDYGKYQPGNKLTYTQLQRYLDCLPRTNSKKAKFNFFAEIYPRLKQIAVDAIKSTFCFLDKERKGNNFEIFGFDFMIDSSFKPWLIQINTNPCLQVNCPVLERIIPSMVENAFRIGLDSIFPPPFNYSSTYKYNIPENALHYNKFQLIFDEELDGKQLYQLYKDNDIVSRIDDYEEDKQIYQEQGQQLDLQEKS